MLQLAFVKVLDCHIEYGYQELKGAERALLHAIADALVESDNVQTWCSEFGSNRHPTHNNGAEYFHKHLDGIDSF